MIKISHFLKVIDVYQAYTGLADGTIGTYVFNDGKQVKRLRNGKDITVGRFNFALNWFSKNWPEDAPWPEGIARPYPSPQPPTEGDFGSDENKEGIE